MKEAKRILLPAIRQFRYNGTDDFLFGYDCEDTQAIVEQLQAENETLHKDGMTIYGMMNSERVDKLQAEIQQRKKAHLDLCVEHEELKEKLIKAKPVLDAAKRESDIHNEEYPTHEDVCGCNLCLAVREYKEE